MQKPKIPRTRTGTGGRSRVGAVEIFDFGGRDRGKLLYPEATRSAAETAMSEARTEINRGFSFRKLDMSKLSHKQRHGAQNFKNSIIAYAEQYGTTRQAAFFRRASAAKLAWMVEKGIIVIEEAFNYDEILDEFGMIRMGAPAEKTLDRYIADYNRLMEMSG